MEILRYSLCGRGPDGHFEIFTLWQRTRWTFWDIHFVAEDQMDIFL